MRIWVSRAEARGREQEVLVVGRGRSGWRLLGIEEEAAVRQED